MVIYKITNKINGKIYIGKRKLAKKLFEMSNYWGSGKYIKMAINKYGKDNFTREVIYECSSLCDMNEKEIFYIQECNSLVPHGYNIQKGGEGGATGRHKEDEGYKHIRELMIGNSYRKGKPPWNKGLKKGIDEKMDNCGIVSIARNKAVSNALKGKPKSEEHKIKMRGENSNTHKLTWNQVLQIRQLYLTGLYSQSGIAILFGTEQSNISDIVNNKTWIQNNTIEN